jgi:hypothetical protein
MPTVRGAVAGCIALSVVLAAVMAVLAVFLAYDSACIAHAKRTKAPASFAHAYVVHGTHRSDRAAHVAALARIAAHALKRQTADETVHVWPATFPSRDPRAQAEYANCGAHKTAGVVKPGEFGCSTSHMRLLQHALNTSPALAEPRTTEWVLVFEDDAQLLLVPQRNANVKKDSAAPAASTIMREAIKRAAALGINAVFFGWWFRPEAPAGGATRVAPQIWRVDGAPLRTHAYALRGALVPAVLHMLQQRRCHVPVDSLLRRTLPSSLLVTRSPHIHSIRAGRGGDALFGQAGLGSDTR